MEEIIIYTLKDGVQAPETLLSSIFATLSRGSLLLTVVECLSETTTSQFYGGYPFLLYKHMIVPRWQILEFWLRNTEIDQGSELKEYEQAMSRLLQERMSLIYVSSALQLKSTLESSDREEVIILRRDENELQATLFAVKFRSSDRDSKTVF